ncbi:putative prefoldin subunit [Clavispora lusitaniae]|uniref:Prefoldin subunit n=1 Tax=Clavispora lusitaniae TaxID=36911 RepID=A0ACD0WIN1_CLALS|nr:putative prefoldin subunit [Clavispora lusitaniae]QFZ33441.1 putative prefoldin subunit [Clavispora lusitaniae]QFZ39112.1 putative prefoldin subunit [Clavispora lusitaniae]QFZ44794.1 putative prefoldin subunit [Clavispora lusitaniae]QFZ50471.1 putative prefoldin subunit [Clavispora lusitaniae]
MDPDRPLLLVLHHCSGFAGEKAISGLLEEKVSQGPIIGVTTVYRLRSDLRDYCACNCSTSRCLPTLNLSYSSLQSA